MTPWLAVDLEQSVNNRDGSAPALRHEDVIEDPIPGRPLTDDELTTLFKALEGRRMEWGALKLSKDTSEEFKITFLKGTWTMEHKGVPCNNVKSYASGEVAEQFCDLYRLGKNASFGLQHYGHKIAVAFARAWCSRMSHVFGTCDAQSLKNYNFSEEDIASWVPPHGWAGARRDLSRRHTNRIADLFGKMPRNFE